MKTKLLVARPGGGPSLPNLTALLFLTATLPALAASLQLGFTVPGSANESNLVPYLDWTGEADRIYRVQRSEDLSSDSWKTVEPVRASSDGPVRWMSPEAIQQRGYYRLVLPQPEVFSVEPALVDSSDPNAALFLLGQCLPTNVLVEINGVIFTAVSVDPGGTALRVSLNGLPPGQPILGAIRILDAGTSNVITEWTVQSPLVYGTELTAEQLQGPPEEPPSSPQPVPAAWASRRGYDYYKARSDLTAAGAQTNPYFAENNNAGEIPEGRISPGAIPGIAIGSVVARAGSGQAFESMELLVEDFDWKGRAGGGGSEGKKGINAVNVKLACSSGELQLGETDLAIPGRGLDFAWTRTYRSRSGTSTAQGAGWDFSYNVSIATQPDGTVLLSTGDGRANTFYPDGTNGWFRDEYFMTIGDLDQDGSPDVVTFADTGKWLFHPPGTASGGKLWQIVDRNGNAITLGYDLAGRLTVIVDTLNRTNIVDYNLAGQIASVTDFSGRTVRYEYDGHGDLVACVLPPVTGTPTGNDFPGGKTNRYTYTSNFAEDRLNHNLTACLDPKGQTWLQIAYQPTTNATSLDFDTVDNLVCGETTHLRRFAQTPSAKNGFATVKAVGCDGLGNVTEYYYDSRQRCLRQLDFTGRANPAMPVTEADNRPANKLRADDPDYFETRWSWNPDSLCTRELRPGGDSTEIVHQRAQDHNSSRSNKTASRRHDGDVRVLRERASSAVDTDGDGVAETTELARYYEYDPRFGSPASRKRVHALHNVSSLNYPLRRTAESLVAGAGAPIRGGKQKQWLPASFRLGASGTVLAQKGLAEVRDFSSIDNAPEEKERACITRFTDARGNVTTASYDANGNRKEIRKTITIHLPPGTNVHHFAYNSHGQCTGITNAADGNGLRRVDTFAYYTNGPQAGYLQSIAIDEPGVHLTTSFEYDARGNVTRCVDPRGNDWDYTYNALDECVRVQTPVNLTERCATDFIYDANGNFVQRSSQLRDANDNFLRSVSSLAEFDLLDRCVSLAEQVSPGVFVTNIFSYDGNSRLIAVLSPLAVSGFDPGNRTAFAYDERGLLFESATAPGTGLGEANRFDYNGNGLCVTVRNVGSLTLRETKSAYDGLNRLVSITDPMSNVVSYAYDRNGNCILAHVSGELNDTTSNTANLRLAEQRWKYDSYDRPIESRALFFLPATQQTIGDGGGVTAVAYAANGACLSVTDDNGRITRYAYDTAGRLASVTDPKANLVTFSYDAGSHVTGIVSSERSDLTPGTAQYSHSYGYDSLGRCVRAVDNVGNTNACAYDSLGRVTRRTDPNGNLSWSVFDDLGRCTLAISDLNGDALPDPAVDVNTSWTYDANSRCLSVTDDNTNTTTFVYDSLDRVVSEANADGTVCSLIWSPRSNLLRLQDPNGSVISNRYDLLDRCFARDITPGPLVAATTTFERYAYDGLSRLVAATNDSSHSEFEFDSLGNCTASRQDGWLVGCTHDALGNPLSLTYPSGLVVSNTYDALDQVTSVSSSSGGLPPVVQASYTYDGPGRLGRISRANNVNTRLQWNGPVNPANGAGDFGWRQVRGVNHQAATGGKVIDQRVASYDRNQNRVRRGQTTPFFVGGSTTTNLFSYDALDRLNQTETTAGGSLRQISYQLDGNGNRQLVFSNGVSGAYFMSSSPPPGPADFQMNQYTVTPFGEQAYDDNGNLVGRTSASGELQFDYDYADRLVLVTDLSGTNPVPVAAFSYDALGQRNTIARYPPGLPSPVVTTFVYAGGSGLEGNYLEARTGALIEAFVHKIDDGLRVCRVSNGGPLFYYHTDDLGNVLALTDSAGAVLERYDYDDFGAPQFLTSDGFPLATNASPAGNPFLFHGMEWQAETKLYHDRGTAGENPFYDPRSGRATRGKVKDIRDSGMGRSFVGHNPWSGTAKVHYNPKEIGIDKSVPWVRKGKVIGTNVPENKSTTRRAKGKFTATNPPENKGTLHGGAGGGGTKAQDHNSSRSNKTASALDPWEEVTIKFIVKK